MKQKISILGSGAMGLALAKILKENGHPVLLWDIRKPKAPIPFKVTLDLAEAVRFSKILFVVIPSPFVRTTLRLIPSKLLNRRWIVNCAKGLDPKTFKLMSQTVHQAVGRESHVVYADLAGPTLAGELCEKHLTGMVIASKNQAVLKKLSSLFKNKYLKVHPSTDLIGVELSGVMKNVYAIGMGLLSVHSPALNTEALFMTQALKEMALLGKKMGARVKTFTDLAGMGDLMATCLSRHSRNYRLGALLGQGFSVSRAQEKIGQVTEGAFSAQTVLTLARKHRVKLPLLEALHAILYEGKKADFLMKVLV